ncbi:hypothetical protein DVA67_031020 [Solirubrobacter sp. CPCC 204708]|uniref:Uncharacterized protein n=1 Tax=Solirubrobacter deserti TaxID=2282478 RepID=A0ABT4RLD4_9ACTN|nr:hypothetical protein [Solirubrobacter deserti]MBE2320436.1 hypothetical protein [Solirubrobacter deserti]MDA0139373.1 hypothetical protein [Solirubrobacter deserti]
MNDQRRFEDWLAGMDVLLDEFMHDLPDEVSAKLDYSLESLDVLEAWFLETYPSIEALRADPSVANWDRATRYYGQVLIKHGGGHWAHNPHNGGGPPQLLGFAPLVPFVPMFLVSASTDRRTGIFLRTIAENNLRARQERG